jgi:hypothetical protein
MPLGRFTAALSVAALSYGVTRAAAASCSPDTRQSTCFDSDALWIPAGASRFVGISSPRAPARGVLVVGADVTALRRPVVLSTRAPDPAGRDVPVVKDVIDVQLGAAYAPVRRVELSLVVPFAVARSGTGLAGVTSQSGPGIGPAFRDLRLGAGYTLLDVTLPDAPVSVAVMPRMDVTLPTGDQDAFAGERGVVFAPRVAGGVTLGRFFVESELGARLRRTVEIGGARLGSEVTASLGIGFDAASHGWLSIGLESWLRASLESQDRGERAEVGSVQDGTLLPAEWMLSVQSRFADFALRAGAGTAIPLSTEKRQDDTGNESTTHLGGVTAPDFRAVFSLRYSPRL